MGIVRRHNGDEGFDMAKTKQDEVVDAGCRVLEEKIAEAWEPEWRELLLRIFRAMHKAGMPD